MPTLADSRTQLNCGTEMTGYPPAGLPVAPTNDPMKADDRPDPQLPARLKMLGLVTDSPTSPTKLTLTWAIRKDQTSPLGWTGTALPVPPVTPGTGQGYIDQSQNYVMPAYPTPSSYNIYRVVRGSGGTPAYVFVSNQSGLSKDLPLPTSPGIYEYTVTPVLNSSGTVVGGEGPFPLTNPQYLIAGIPVTVDVTAPADQTWTNGVAITNVTLAAAGGSTPYTWGISPALPTGVSLNASSGVISGTPTVTVAQTAYTVTATETGGAAGQATFNATVNPPVPNAPGTTAASAITTTTTTLTWTAPGSGPTPTGYKIYDTTASRPGTLLAGPQAGLTFAVTNGVAGTTRKYAVSAMNGATEGAQNSDRSVLFVPGAPVGMASANITTTNVDLTWTATTGATTYNVYDTTASRPGTKLTSSAVSSPAYTATNGVTSTTRKYAMTAINASGEGAESVDFSVTFA